MTPEQHAIYQATYSQALNMTLTRSASPEAAVREASDLAALAIKLYPADDQPAKRGPGRPPKEVQA